MKELLMGNEAIAIGAIMAGVKVVSGYPGTPSTEVLETIAKRNPGNIHVEWSTNEKAALEVAAGAAYTGARSIVTMKQVGLNVASDPLMSLNYVGVKGGMVVYVADDPGPISSQTEQDTRHYGKFAKIPVFDPVSPEEAYEMIQEAFEYSERYGMPVFFRATTRVCHSCATVDVGEFPEPRQGEGFVKDSSRWVIFPKLSYQNKKKLEARETVLADEFSENRFNSIENIECSGASDSSSYRERIGIACGGISYAYVTEAVNDLDRGRNIFKIFKCATPYPFPEKLALRFLTGDDDAKPGCEDKIDKLIVFEELDPVIEDAFVYICGKHNIKLEIHGKRDMVVPNAGELSYTVVKEILSKLIGFEHSNNQERFADLPEIPGRPPVLCAGCPHRASFYAVKKAMQGRRAVFCGDIGCYTLGNAAPLDMVDTCLCMGAGINIAQGLEHAKPGESVNFAFVGDSTFFASGITGVINGVYNKADMVLVVLDNSTTAMTGHQPHPGIGKTMMGDVSASISIPKILEAIGVTKVMEVNPLDYETAVAAVREAADLPGVKAIIFKSPCVAIVKNKRSASVDSDRCIGCRKCINELGCPALYIKDGKACIDKALCTSCGLCAQICPVKCIRSNKSEEEA